MRRLVAASSAHAALLGLNIHDPMIDAAAGGVIAFNTVARVVTISGTPQLLQQLSPFLFAEFTGTGLDDERLITIQFKVDANGNFLSGVDGPDLAVKGAVDTDFDGVPLEAEVTQFSFFNGAAGANDHFGLRLTGAGEVHLRRQEHRHHAHQQPAGDRLFQHRPWRRATAAATGANVHVCAH